MKKPSFLKTILTSILISTCCTSISHAGWRYVVNFNNATNIAYSAKTIGQNCMFDVIKDHGIHPGQELPLTLGDNMGDCNPAYITYRVLPVGSKQSDSFHEITINFTDHTTTVVKQGKPEHSVVVCQPEASAQRSPRIIIGANHC